MAIVMKRRGKCDRTKTVGRNGTGWPWGKTKFARKSKIPSPPPPVIPLAEGRYGTGWPWGKTKFAWKSKIPSPPPPVIPLAEEHGSSPPSLPTPSPAASAVSFSDNRSQSSSCFLWNLASLHVEYNVNQHYQQLFS